MPRAVRPWFRLYTEAFGDRKLRRLKPEYRWLFVACLGAARQSPEPGVLLVAEGQPMDEQDLADYAGMDTRTVRYGLRALVAAGLLEVDSASAPGRLTYFSRSFQDRQYESDNVTNRTRKHRATREDTNVGTFPSRSRERSNVVPGNGIGTDQRQRQIQRTDTGAGAAIEPDPVGEPEPAGPTEQLVAEWVAFLGDQGRPPSRLKDAVGQQIHDLLADGIPYADVKRGLIRWQTRGNLGPAVLPSIVHEVRTARPDRTDRRQAATTDLFDRALQRAQQADQQKAIGT